MNFVLVFILPSVFGFKLMYENLEKKNKLNLFIYGCMILVLTNMICTGLILINNKTDGSIVDNAYYSMFFSVTYMLLSIFIGCIVGFIITIIDKYFNINIEVKHEKKNNKNSKNNK